MTDSRAGERFMIIDPTGVPDALRGRGMGRGVEDAQSCRCAPSPRLKLPPPRMAGRAKALMGMSPVGGRR